MGLFDGLAGQALNALGGGSGAQAASLMGPLVQTLGGGGLSSILGHLSTSGLANEVESWVGTGPNLPVSPAQLQSALPTGFARELAGKAGIATGDIHGLLAQLLPDVVNQITPTGQLPSPGAVLPDAASIWAKMLS